MLAGNQCQWIMVIGCQFGAEISHLLRGVERGGGGVVWEWVGLHSKSHHHQFLSSVGDIYATLYTQTHFQSNISFTDNLKGMKSHHHQFLSSFGDIYVTLHTHTHSFSVRNVLHRQLKKKYEIITSLKALARDIWLITVVPEKPQQQEGKCKEGPKQKLNNNHSPAKQAIC